METIEGGSKESQETKTKSEFIRRVNEVFDGLGEQCGGDTGKSVIIIAGDGSVKDGEDSGNSFYGCAGKSLDVAAILHCAMNNNQFLTAVKIAMVARGEKVLDGIWEEHIENRRKQLKVYNAFTAVALLFVAAITVLFVIGQMSLLPYCGNMLIMGCALFNSLMNRHLTIRQIKSLKKEFKS